jgi:Acyl-CoA carboxylase epsilon subunit
VTPPPGELSEPDAAPAAAGSDNSDERVRPLLRVVRGNPSPEELAALIAVVSARGAAVEEPPPPARSLWAAPSLRQPLHPGPGAWRASALPR